MKQKAEEIYRRFVNYEWNEVGDGMQKSILDAIETALKEGRKLATCNGSCSYLPKCTRVEVIDKRGRSYTNYDCKNVEMQMQDEDRTLKVFIS